MRTESNIKPLVQHEIEALPKMVGRTCTVIFYENIEGPIEKEEGDQVYTYDRYTLETQYRENLEESIEKNREAWLQKAIKAEQEGEEKTEMEILQEQVASLQDENAALKASNESLPSRERGLKSKYSRCHKLVRTVAPFRGTKVEIRHTVAQYQIRSLLS